MGESMASQIIPNTKGHDLTGRVFGRWTVLGLFAKATLKKNKKWLCRCKCGHEGLVYHGTLTSGISKSCGCLKKELNGNQRRTHGMSESAEHYIWMGVLRRCNNPSDPAYPYYGGRGITVCERWLKFQNFIDDMGVRPNEKLTMDRINNGEGYCKENCRWTTRKAQANNRRSNRVIEHNGEMKTLTEWAEIAGMRSQTLGVRLKLGWSMAKAMSTPIRDWKEVHNAKTS